MEAPANPAIAVYSPAQIVVATILGGPVAAAFLVAANHDQIPGPDVGWRWRTGGVIGTGLLLTVGRHLPAGISHIAAAGCVVGFYLAAKRLQTTRWAGLAGSSPQRSWWEVIGVCFLAGAVILVVAAAFWVAAILLRELTVG
jgi:hypothetical protein